jgi:hypothetical protein
MNKTFALIFAAACSVNASAAFAQATAATPANATASPLSPIYACAEKTDPVQRLACFDAAVAAVKAAEGRNEIVAMDQPRVAAVRREAFGFRIPSLPRFGFGTPAPATTGAPGAPSPAARPREEDTEEQTFAVARVGSYGGRTAIYLVNGGVWQLTDAGELNAPRTTPFNVRIRAAALGSYMLQVEGRNKGYRVRRVE